MVMRFQNGKRMAAAGCLLLAVMAALPAGCSSGPQLTVMEMEEASETGEQSETVQTEPRIETEPSIAGMSRRTVRLCCLLRAEFTRR